VIRDRAGPVTFGEGAPPAAAPERPPQRTFISALIRCSVGGCVLNMLSNPCTENGLMMNM
jgi:hypothetical protein